MSKQLPPWVASGLSRSVLIPNVKGAPRSGQLIRRTASLFTQYEKELKKSKSYKDLLKKLKDDDKLADKYGKIFADTLQLSYLKGHYPKKVKVRSSRLIYTFNRMINMPGHVHARALNSVPDWFDIDYTLFDEKALHNFREEALIVAGINTKEALADIKKSAEKAISEGTTFADFYKEIKLKGYNIQNPYYLRTNFDTGINSAYLAGHWQDYEDTKDMFPYLKYMTVGDELVRESHAELDGYIAAVDDPFWDQYYPPNDWNCRCEAWQFTKDEAEKDKMFGKKPPHIKIGNEFQRNAGKTGHIFDKFIKDKGKGDELKKKQWKKK